MSIVQESRMAFKAGRDLYGDGLVFESTVITYRTLSERLLSLMEEGVCSACLMDADTYEYAFGLDESGGIECADESLFLFGGMFRQGVDVLEMDIDEEGAKKLMSGYD